MARPRNANAEATRSNVLDAACRLFSERGVPATSVREIARHAGVSLAMIHHYFGSKDGLHEQCLAHSHATLSDGFAELTSALGQVGDELGSASGDRRREIVAHLVREALGLAREHPHAVRLLMRTLVEPADGDDGWRETVALPFIDRTAVTLAHALGRDAGALRWSLQSLMALIMRYTVASADELAVLAGLTTSNSTTTEDERASALGQAEDHLTEVAQLLLLSAAPTRTGGIDNER